MKTKKKETLKQFMKRADKGFKYGKGQRWDEKAMREMEAPWPKDLEELTKFTKEVSSGTHHYGTCVYAMSLAATAAFNYVARKLGTTGFQAGCADLDILRRTRHLKGPFMLVRAEEALYPQYDFSGKLEEAKKDWQPWLRDEARKKIKETDFCSAEVFAHWLRLAELEGEEKEFYAEKYALLCNPWTLDFVEDNVDKFKKFGITRVYLFNSPNDDSLVNKAEKCKEGCSFRHNLPTGLDFERNVDGIKVHWTVDTEKEGSNGAPSLNINWPLLDSLYNKANPKVQRVIKKYIARAKKANVELSQGQAKELRKKTNSLLKNGQYTELLLLQDPLQ